MLKKLTKKEQDYIWDAINRMMDGWEYTCLAIKGFWTETSDYTTRDRLVQRYADFYGFHPLTSPFKYKNYPSEQVFNQRLLMLMFFLEANK